MIIIQIACLLTVAVIPVFGAEAEDAEAVDDWSQQLAEIGVTPLDTAIISFMALFCALLLSFFGVLFGYFSVKEDMLMKRYQRDGIPIRAAIDVDTITLTRRLVTNKPTRPQCCRKRDTDAAQQSTQIDHHECCLVMEYKCVGRNPQSFTKRVRKQVRALDSDFLETKPGWSPPKIPAIRFDLQPEEMHISFEGPVPSHDYPMRDGGLELDILQLPQYIKSGIPQKQVERACSWSYRLPTMLMVAVCLVFAAGCTYFAVTMAAAASSSRIMLADNMDGLVWSSATVSLMLTCEILLIRRFGESHMNKALHHEYLDGGDMLVDYGDSASLSSGDDSFLAA